MAGLISNVLPAASTDSSPGANNVVSAGSVGVDPELRTVDAPKETVSGQLDSLLAKDSPYIERARAGAAGTANSRGLLNSSMAAGAGEAAAIDAALPIAAADANTYSSTAGVNQQTKNVALGTNAQAANTAAITNANAANTLGLQGLRGDQAKTLADIESNYKQLMQANSSASATFNEATQQISTIMRDPSTSAEQKQAAVESVNQLLQSSLAATSAISNIDLLGILDFSGGTPVPA